MRKWFDDVDRNHSGSIDAKELKKALKHAGAKYSTKEAQKMIDMYDLDDSHTITFDEFRGLYNYLQDLDISFDKQGNGEMSLDQVQSFFQQKNVGSELRERDQHVAQLFKKHAGSQGKISKKQFIMIAIALGILVRMYNKRQKGH